MDITDEAKHRVYISFDNNDSSISTFINYLRATFKRHGIYRDRDDKIERFSDIIRVLVVVFSKGYALSALENFLNGIDKNSLVVVPVLYGVTESSVQQHIGFLKRRLPLEPAVSHAHVYNDERSESEFLVEIAQDVFDKLYPTEEIGIFKEQLKIEKLLCKQPWGVRSLGIFGEKGIGKTTLATAVFDRMVSGYDDSLFVKDFQSSHSKLGPLSPGKTPMEKLDQTCSDSDSKPSYRKKRLLVALDDVQNFQNAVSFLGSLDEFGPGSLIIIISRQKTVLEQCEMKEIYELKGLNDEDALKLFTRCAFKTDIIEKNLLDLSKKEIERAKGNPFALRLSAKEFKGKTELEPALPNVCQVFITETGDDVCSDIAKNTSIHITPYEKEDEPQETKELPLDHNPVFATRDTQTLIMNPSYMCLKANFDLFLGRTQDSDFMTASPSLCLIIEQFTNWIITL